MQAKFGNEVLGWKMKRPCLDEWRENMELIRGDARLFILRDGDVKCGHAAAHTHRCSVQAGNTHTCMRRTSSSERSDAETSMNVHGEGQPRIKYTLQHIKLYCTDAKQKQGISEHAAMLHDAIGLWANQ